MDTPTHALIGRLIARRVWPDKDENATVNLVTAMGVLPDVDTFFGGDDLTYIQAHRGITHSVFGAAAFGLIVALVAGRLGVRGPFSRRYLISVAGMLLHVLFDVFTSYGTQVLAPFSDYRSAIDVLFIIDPYLTGLLILSLVVGWRVRRDAYRVGFSVFVLYVGMNFALLGYGHLQARQWAEGQGVQADRVGVMPMPFSPLHRRAFVESGDQTYWVTVPAFGKVGQIVERFPRALAQEELGFAWETDTGRTYRWFSRYPVVTSRSEKIVMVEDLTYKMSGSGLGWIGNGVLWAAQSRAVDIRERKLFYLEIDLEASEVAFSR